MEKLSNRQTLYQNILPKTYSIKRVLENRIKEVALTVHKNEEDAFKRFRSQLHGTLWNKIDVELKYKNMNPKKEESYKFTNKEPGDFSSYGNFDYYLVTYWGKV